MIDFIGKVLWELDDVATSLKALLSGLILKTAAYIAAWPYPNITILLIGFALVVGAFRWVSSEIRRPEE